MAKAKGRCANPLYLKLLEEWKEELHEKNPESNIVNVLRKAITSLRNHTAEIPTPRDCLPLPGFGPWVVKGLTARVVALEGGADSSSPPHPKKRVAKASVSDDADSGPKPRGRPKKVKDPASEASSSQASGPVKIPRAVPKNANPIKSLGWDPYSVETVNTIHHAQPEIASRSKTASTTSAALPLPPGQSVAPQHPSQFDFWYLDPDKSFVTNCDKAEVTIVDGCTVCYTVEFPASASSHPLARQLRHSQAAPRRPGFCQTLVGMMPEEIAVNNRHSTSDLEQHRSSKSLATSQKPVANTLAAQLQAEGARNRSTIDPARQATNLPQIDKVASSSARTADLKGKEAVGSSEGKATNRTVSAPIADLFPPARSSSIAKAPTPVHRPMAQKISRTDSAPLPRAMDLEPVVLRTVAGRSAPRGPRISTHIPPPRAIDGQLERLLNEGVGEAVDDAEDDVVFRLPFEPTIISGYEVLFILDSREIKSKKNRDYIQTQLAKRGVAVETRALELGDMCWIAREYYSGREFVLDYIIERKRIDDLVGSIKDGRFHEQKFRLTQSGISRVYYLVEEYDGSHLHGSMDKAVFTALSSTQVVEGFFLKETRDIEDTIEYIAGLHFTIVEQYKGNPIHVIPDDAIKRHSYMALQTRLRDSHPNTPYHTSYAMFRELNRSSVVTLKDCFARMLLCVRGMSAEKAATIIEHYDTPRRLWDAFRDAEELEVHERAAEEAMLAAGTGKGRKKKSQVIPARLMLTRLPAKGRREIKDALAGQVYDLFMTDY